MTASVPLGEVAEFVNGVAFKPGDWGETGAPIIRIQNLTSPEKPFNRTSRSVGEKLHVQPGDLLVSWSATLGVFVWPGPEVGLLNQHIFRVLPKDGLVEKDYLGYMLAGALNDMRRHLHGATMQHVNRGEFLATKIPLPSLTEQRRVATILDQADALRTKRRQTLALLDDLGQAVFLDMFGDPVKHGSYPLMRLGEVADIQIGPFGSLLHREDYVEGGVPLINPMHIVGGLIAPDPSYSIPSDMADTLTLYRIREGDVVMGRRGEMGRCAVAAPEHAGMLCGTGSLIVRPRIGYASPIYLWAALRQPSVKSMLERRALGATLPNLNASIVKDIALAIPPMAAQERFEHRLLRVSAHRDDLEESDWSLQLLVKALQGRAYDSGFAVATDTSMVG
ncbi:restriction endonuclease subunit S [Tessaracoccus sp. Y1736]